MCLYIILTVYRVDVYVYPYASGVPYAQMHNMHATKHFVVSVDVLITVVTVGSIARRCLYGHKCDRINFKERERDTNDSKSLDVTSCVFLVSVFRS